MCTELKCIDVLCAPLWYGCHQIKIEWWALSNREYWSRFYSQLYLIGRKISNSILFADVKRSLERSQPRNWCASINTMKKSLHKLHSTEANSCKTVAFHMRQHSIHMFSLFSTYMMILVNGLLMNRNDRSDRTMFRVQFQMQKCNFRIVR